MTQQTTSETGAIESVSALKKVGNFIKKWWPGMAVGAVAVASGGVAAGAGASVVGVVTAAGAAVVGGFAAGIGLAIVAVPVGAVAALLCLKSVPKTINAGMKIGFAAGLVAGGFGGYKLVEKKVSGDFKQSAEKVVVVSEVTKATPANAYKYSV